MEKLIYIDQNNLKNNKFVTLLLCVFTAVAEVGCFCSVFNITNFTIGFKKLWNTIATTVLNDDGIVLKELSGASDSFSLFIPITIIAFALVSWLIFKSENKWLLLIFVAIPLIPTLVTSLAPAVLWAIVLVGALALDFIYINQKSLSRWNVILVALMVSLVLTLVFLPATSKYMTRPYKIGLIDKKIEKKIDQFKYGKSPLGGGDLYQTKRDVDEDQVALEVTMSKPQSMYLRGFVGEVHNGNTWETLPYEDYDQSKNLMYWLEKENFSGMGQIGQAGILTGTKDKDIDVEINVKKANKKYGYIPYEISELGGDEVNWYNNYLTKNNRSKMKSYQYKTKQNSVKNWTEIAAKMFTKEKTKDMKKYLVNESYYNQFVYEKYTYLSISDIRLMKNYIGNKGDQSKGHIEYKTAINKVKKYLDENILYTENPGLITDKNTDVTSAIFEKNKGYDIHYATAATLMFRYYGIPARYVEGYLLTPDAVKKAKAGEKVEITPKDIHAWTEIYVDGVGFVPIEVCPEYEGRMEEADMTIGLSNNAVKKKFEQNNNSVKSKQQTKENKTNKDIDFKIGVIVTIAILGLLLLLLIYFLYRCVKKWIVIYRRNKLFKKGEAKVAVAAMYGYMEELKLDIGEEEKILGNKAAYSQDEISEEDRENMAASLKRLKKEKKSHGKNQKKKK